MEKKRAALRIDLWTKEMMVDEMADFYYQTMMTMADTFDRATHQQALVGEMKDFAKQFLQQVQKINARTTTRLTSHNPYYMSLEQTINDNLKKAMLAKDEKGLRALRAIKASILLAKTAEGAGETLSEDTEMKLLQKLVKQRRDSIDIFEQQNRADLAQKEKRRSRSD